MSTGTDANFTAKPKWEAPVLIELDLGMENVENGFNPGSDGAGGLNTSLS